MSGWGLRYWPVAGMTAGSFDGSIVFAVDVYERPDCQEGDWVARILWRDCL